MAKGIVYVSFNNSCYTWSIWKTRQSAVIGQIDGDFHPDFIKDDCNLPELVNRPLNKKKIYRITCKEA